MLLPISIEALSLDTDNALMFRMYALTFFLTDFFLGMFLSLSYSLHQMIKGFLTDRQLLQAFNPVRYVSAVSFY